MTHTPDIPPLEEPRECPPVDPRAAASGPVDAPAPPDPNDTHLAPDLAPPPESPFERATYRAALWGFFFWTIVLALLWLFPPAWHATIRLFDLIFWPLIRVLGRRSAVAFLAAATAFLTLLAQVLLTDTPLLHAVKQRAHILRDQQQDLPLHSPREDALHAAVLRAHWRIGRAGLVPVGLLLGPMIAAFLWLPARVDPAHINPAPGAAVILTAPIDGNNAGPVLLSSAGQAIPDDPPQAGAPQPQTFSWPITLPAGAPAIHRYSLTAQSSSVQIDLPTGDAAPPPLYPQRQANTFAWQHPGAGIIHTLTITCPDPRLSDQRTFWQPFAWTGWHWDAGWLGLYFVIYIPAMYLSRRLLRVP